MMDMKIFKNIAALTLALVMLVLLAACNDGAGEQTSSTTPAPNTTLAPSTTPAPDTTLDSGMVDYKVKVVDSTGAPVSGVMVQICFGGLCTPAKTDAEGVAIFKKAKDSYTVKFMNGVPSGYTCDAEEFAFGDATELTITLTPAQ